MVNILDDNSPAPVIRDLPRLLASHLPRGVSWQHLAQAPGPAPTTSHLAQNEAALVPGVAQAHFRPLGKVDAVTEPSTVGSLVQIEVVPVPVW